MATRFYLSSTSSPTVTPGFAAWTRTTEGDRRRMSPVKDSSAMTSKTMWAGTSPAANASALNRQYVSNPMDAGIAFTVAQTIKGVLRCMESGTDDNINRQPICVKVYSADGLTLRATLLALLHYGPNTTEWISGTLTSKQLSTGTVFTSAYTTVAGDRLVVEIGGQVSSAGGTSVTGTQSFGSNGASDLLENEAQTAALNPWIEVSTNITFLTTYKDISTRFLLYARGYKDISTRFRLTTDLYWVGDGGNWSDATHHWAAVSGGAPNANYIPTANTHVHFDAASFTLAGQTVKLDAAGIPGGVAYCADMDWTGAQHNPTFDNIDGIALFVSGSFTTILAMIWSSWNNNIWFFSTTTGHTIRTNGLLIKAGVVFDADATHQGGWSFLDDFTNWVSTAEGYDVDFFNGTVITNGHTIRTDFFANTFSNPGTTRVLNLTNSYIQCRYWGNGDNTNLVLTLTGSTIEVGPEEWHTITYPRNGFENDYAEGGYNIVKFTCAWIQVSSFSGFTPTIATLQLQPAFATQQVNFYTGDPPNPIGLIVGNVTRTGIGMITLCPDGDSPGGSAVQPWFITKLGGGTVNLDYITVSYSTGNPALTWYARIHSVNGGNDIQWYFETQGYLDIGTRFKLIARNFIDIATRFKLRVQGYKDTNTRFPLVVRGYQDTNTRFPLQVRNYKDISSRYILRVRNYVDISSRYILQVRGYANTATRYVLQVRNYTDTVTRFMLWVRNYADTDTRFFIIVQSYRDVSTRFILRVQGYADTNTRLFLVVQGYIDVSTRFTLTVRGYSNVATRFVVIVLGYIDVGTRFLIIAQNYVDAITRFLIIVQTYRDTQTRYQLIARGYVDVGTRFELKVGGGFPVIGGDSVIGGYPVIGGGRVIK